MKVRRLHIRSSFRPELVHEFYAHDDAYAIERAKGLAKDLTEHTGYTEYALEAEDGKSFIWGCRTARSITCVEEDNVRAEG